MAKRDVVMYFLQVQSNYLEMLNDVKDFKESVEKGYMEQSQLEAFSQNLEVIKNNYERLAYVMLLLNQPNRKDKKSLDESTNKEWYSYLKGASKEAILDENRDALADFKELVRKYKDEHK